MLLKSSLIGICSLLLVCAQKDPPKDDTSATYLASIPKYIRPGFNITYSLWVKSDNDVNVFTAFYSSDGELELTAENLITSNDGEINVGMVPLGYSGSTKFTMNITGADATTGEEIFYDSTTMFSYASKSVSVFIQTDKAIYQPGETIKFRATCLNPDLRPLTGLVKYQVQDPNGNIILLNEAAMLSHGVVGGELVLNKDAVNGDWKITYIVLGHKEELPVTVRFYKLPKFEVTLDTPSYIHPESEGFTIRLNAVYTYGKGVDGTASLKIDMQYRYGPANPPRIITKNFNNYDGSLSVFITKDEIMKELGWDGQSERKIVVTGDVTEDLTGAKFNDVAEILVERTHIKLETLYKPDTIKPGLLYTAYIRVSEQDGKPLMEDDRLSNKLVLEITYGYPYIPRPFFSPRLSILPPFPTQPPPQTEIQSYDIPASGVVAVTITAKNDNFTYVTFKPYTNATETFGRYANQWQANRAESPSNSYLQINTDDSTVAPGEIAHVVIRTTEAVHELKLMLIARGKLLYEALYTTPSGQPETVHNWNFQVTNEMMPSVQILVTYIRSDGEVVADYLTLSVSLSLENQIAITSSAMSVDAGSDVNIQVQTSRANSYVGLRAIDQSVLLLKSGNDISQKRIVDDLNDYSVSDNKHSNNNFFFGWYYPRPSGAKDTKGVFDNAGIIVLTDGLIYQAQPDYAFRRFPVFALAGGFGDVNVPRQAPLRLASQSVTTPPSPSPARVRSFFPETWIWEEGVTGADGSATFNTKVPDTITSWVISAFSVSDEYGLGVADTTKITVFRNFFISLNLPLKITRGEIIVVQAIVFNYFDTDLNVNFTLTLDNGLELLIPGDDPIAAGPQRMLKVKSNGAVSVKFPVQSNGLGELRITASAVSQMAADALTRTVFVRPEGIKQCYSASALINRNSYREPAFREQLEIKLPKGMVTGSGVVKLFTYGDILGGTMNNLGRLLVAPSGCGEQNMLGFAPDVFVTLYLERAGMLDANTRKKAYQHFHDGYMTELKYKHKDGSYSAFGERDDSGSTWLTAFVAKCFIFARELRPELVESRIIDEAINFLVDQQNSNGTFNEPGRVIHTEMQGRVSSPITMTAYVLITLRETVYPYKNQKVQQAAQRAREYLESSLNSIKTNKYVLALVTYALHVSGSSRASEALTALEALATVEGGLTYWQETTTAGSSYSLQWRPPYRRAPSNDIEMTAYALLTYVRRNDLGSAAPVMKWLTSKQNELGGYSSTQDTVIAIQALSNVARLLINRDQDLTITAAHSNDPTFSESVAIDSSNSIVLNSVAVPPISGNLIIQAFGVGIGVAQLSVCYNIPNDPYEDEPFRCTVDVSNKDVSSATVSFCCSLKQDEEATGMFVFEIGLLNGFTADKINEEERNPTAKMIEIDDDSVDVYYDQLSPGGRLCANVELLRYADVGASKPATLMAFDYYKPERKVNRLYSVDGLGETGPCQVCGSECVGCLDASLADWKPWSPCIEFCKPEISTRTRPCVDHNLRKEVDVRKCGLEETSQETRMCAKGFPCPDFNEGLWYDLPRGFGYYRGACQRVDTLKSPRDVIPGTSLNGNSSYISCNSQNNDVKVAFNSETGFSVSFLVNPSSYQPRTASTFIAYGADGVTPFYWLEKLWWKRNEIRFYINYGRHRNTIRRISTTDIPPQRWSHIMITWNKRVGAKVFANGREVGQAISILRSTTATRSNLKLYLGRSGTSSIFRQGHVAGTFSALNYWSNTLTQDEVQAVSSFYQEITQYRGPEPLLTPRHLRAIAPERIQHCFRESIFLSAFYAGNTDANKQCQFHRPVVPRPLILF